MTDTENGWTLSDDGNYWWDGAEWQPVAGGEAAGAEPTSEPDPEPEPEGTYELFSQGAGLNGSALQVLVGNRGTAEAPANAYAGTIEFDQVAGGTRTTVCFHELYLGEAIPATETRTIGVMVPDAVRQQDGEYVAFLTSPGASMDGDDGRWEFTVGNGDVAPITY